MSGRWSWFYTKPTGKHKLAGQQPNTWRVLLAAVDPWHGFLWLSRPFSMCPWLATTTTSHRLTFGLTTNVCLHRVPRTISPPYSVKQHTHIDTHTHIVDSKEKEKQKQFEYEPVVARWPPPPPSPPPLPPLRWRKNCDDAVAIKRPAKTQTQKKETILLGHLLHSHHPNVVSLTIWRIPTRFFFLRWKFFFTIVVNVSNFSTA